MKTSEEEWNNRARSRYYLNDNASYFLTYFHTKPVLIVLVFFLAEVFLGERRRKKTTFRASFIDSIEYGQVRDIYIWHQEIAPFCVLFHNISAFCSLCSIFRSSLLCDTAQYEEKLSINEQIYCRLLPYATKT